MTPQPNAQNRASAMPGAAMRGTPMPGSGGALRSAPSAAQRPRTDPWPGQPVSLGQPQAPAPHGQPQYGQQPGRAPQQGQAQQPRHPQQQQPQASAQQAARAQAAPRASVGRRWLGLLAFVVLAGLSLPIHVLALFFAFVEFASPGDASTAILLVIGAFAGSFVALLVTAIVSQLIGGFPSRWRVRITFAVTNAVLALGVALIASLTLF